MNPTAEQLQARINATGQAPVPQPVTPSPISVSTLTTPPTPMQVQSSPTIPPPTITAPTTTTTPAPTPAPTPTDFTTNLEALQAKLAGKTLDTAASKTAATAPYEQQLNDINRQLAERQAQAIANQEKVLASGGDTSFQSGESQRIARTDAIEVLKLQALQAGLQGNITLAEKKAQTAIDTKYGQIEQDIETAKSNIYANYDSLSAAEKKRADTTLLRLDANDAFVKSRKADETLIFDTVKTALSYGADTATVQKMYAAKSPEEAMQIGAPFLRDPKAQYEVLKAKYDAEKARLDAAAAANASKPLQITGNTIKDVAAAIASNKVGQSTKTTLSAIMGVQGALEQFAKDNPGGDFKGISPFNTLLDATIPFTQTKLLNLPFGARDALMSKEAITSRAYINGINLKVQQWASGAALTVAQTRQVEQMTPKTDDTDRVAKEKVNALYEFMNQQVRSAMLSEGIEVPVPQNVDLWQNTDSLSGIFGE